MFLILISIEWLFEINKVMKGNLGVLFLSIGVNKCFFI